MFTQSTRRPAHQMIRALHQPLELPCEFEFVILLSYTKTSIPESQWVSIRMTERAFVRVPERVKVILSSVVDEPIVGSKTGM
jgi:hypothetical protein